MKLLFLLCLLVVLLGQGSQVESKRKIKSDQKKPISKSVEIRTEKCRFLADPGPCRGKFKMVAYDLFSNRCMIFFYGGCGGNPNRFPSEEICRHACLVRKTDGDYPENNDDYATEGIEETTTEEPEEETTTEEEEETTTEEVEETTTEEAAASTEEPKEKTTVEA